MNKCPYCSYKGRFKQIGDNIICPGCEIYLDEEELIEVKEK